tara:strand:+ start:1400 stop:3718 length:2319 start_codon:yes stop_codon:yes gene_type:complete
MDLVPFREDFEYNIQRRKKPAVSVWSQEDIAGCDFETKDGYPHIMTWTIFKDGTYMDYTQVFGGTIEEPNMFLEANGGKRYPAFDISSFCYRLFVTGKYSQGGWGKRQKPQEMYFYNLSYDASSIIKTLPVSCIQTLMFGDTITFDTLENVKTDRVERVKMKNVKWHPKAAKSIKRFVHKWRVWNEDKTSHKKMAMNRYIQITYLPKKWLGIEPLNHYTKGMKWGKIDCWDIAPFCGGGSLNYQSKKHLDEGKDKMTNDEMSLLGSLTPEGIQFTINNWDKILKYAEKDSNLTARLSWKMVRDFEAEGVRMSRPYSPASVASRAALDRCEIPTMNDMINSNLEDVKAAWTSANGGHFESTGSGFVERVQAKDITSAYPAVMWWLPDTSKGHWIGSLSGDDGVEDYFKRGYVLYGLSFFEAEVIFPPGLEIYPAATKSETAGCLMNPRIAYKWFTGDEITEFKKWGAEVNIERWSAFIADRDNEPGPDVEDGVKYPFRPFIKVFYGGKLNQDNLKKAGSPEYDPQKRNIYKLMINSLFGKTYQAIKKDGIRQTGPLWNPFYASTITAGCRMRIAEIIRVNNYENVLSVATDGIIFKHDKEIIVPENPMPVTWDGERINLGDWEDDGEGSLLLMMSGVYSIIKETVKNYAHIETDLFDAKNTFRGAYSLFLDYKNHEGELNQDFYGEDWVSFCDRFSEETKVSRTEETNPTMRPYSLGEAKVRNDYALVNQFRIVKVSITPNGDSNKRRWDEKPQTFGELASKWWPSGTWENLI